MAECERPDVCGTDDVNGQRCAACQEERETIPQPEPVQEDLLLPACPKCSQPMLSSYAIAYHEFVCVPCGHAEEFLNGLPKLRITRHKEAEMRTKYRMDLRLLGFTRGGATCGECRSRKGNECPKCQLPEALEYWGKGAA